MSSDKKFRKYIDSAAERLHKAEPGYRSASNLSFFLYVLGVLIAALAIRAFLLEPVRVQGESMQNTLQHGERLIAEKVSFWFDPPEVGDIIITRFPDREGAAFVKRIVAVGGQTVAVRDGFLSDGTHYRYVEVDGVPLDESAYRDTMLLDGGVNRYSYIECAGSVNGEFTVPEGYVFVMGDHRTNSSDSRVVGAIPLHYIIGRVHGVIVPVEGTSIRLVD